MTPGQITEIVIAKVTEITLKDPSEITLKSKFDDLEIDSFETMELIDQIEKALGIVIPYEWTIGVETVETLVELCQQLIDIQTIISRVLETQPGTIPSGLGADHQRIVDLLMSLGDKFDFDVMDGDAENINTIQDVYSYVRRQIAES